jgi:two-component system, cell cycle response regulator DivK
MDYNWKNKTILIAEDSEMNFILIKKSLEVSGAKILWAKDGEELIESVKKSNSIDLILMDISMPKMDGYTASKTLRNEGFEVPIIAQSAFSIEEEKDKIADAGCNDFISKPINKEELLEKIDSLI